MNASATSLGPTECRSNRIEADQLPAVSLEPEIASRMATLDANEAVARVAYSLSEVIAIYPITPATPMGEWADQWAAGGVRNLWGTVPAVIEMQSEAGAAGALHGALQTGSLATTFTASQGLLLMIPNMFKIAGELTPAVFHIASRAIASQALSIFGDHSDVMAARSTGWAMLCAASVQEAQDFALIAHAATLKARIPFLHFFDGFRTSHEIAKIELVEPSAIAAMIDPEDIREHRARALSPDHPVLRGSAQNPDVFFQARETVNRYYAACPAIVQRSMDAFGELTGRRYRLFEYYGAPHPERVIVMMGSGCEAVSETVDFLNGRGENVGLVKVRLYRPFDSEALMRALPSSVKAMAVLDRTKEPGASGEPLYLDCVEALYRAGRNLQIVGGRYGLGSKEFTPAMIKAAFDNLSAIDPKHHFTVGIQDDVSASSLEYDSSFSVESDDVFRAVFYGLGSDGTVGANKESIKIIGEKTGYYAQGYFVYDSKKAGAVTVSHLRFGPRPIRSSYLISEAQFVGCHQPIFLERFDVAEKLMRGGTLLLNTPHDPSTVWETIPSQTQRRIIEQRARLFVIDATAVARECGMPGRINVAMQVCFFAISGVLPHEEALEAIRDSIRASYAQKGDEIVARNLAIVDVTLSRLQEVRIPSVVGNDASIREPIPGSAPEYVRKVIGPMIAGRGDALPVSALPCDGTFPTGTSRWEKRNLAAEVPVWEPSICIQCAKCVIACPHAVIRSKVYEPACLRNAPATFQSHDARLPDWQGLKFTLQIAVEDCTGCGICVDVCPVRDKSETRRKAINMEPQMPLREDERQNWEFFLSLPELDRRRIPLEHVRSQQVQQPLFEFSGACAGCGETPYLKLLSQLFGDRLLVANATGCSSIYGGNLPTTPWAQNTEGRGPAWSNSLFEDAAEFGMGFRASLDQQRQFAGDLLRELAPTLGDTIVKALIEADQSDEAGIYEQRERVAELKQKLGTLDSEGARRLLAICDSLVYKSVWIVGGDGWGYDIGYGGLDHVLASGANVKVLLLDTEVYSNTGGQCSKATPLGAVAKFAAGGKRRPKKDLGLICMTYGSIYVASVALGAKDEHTVRAFLEAESFDGPAIIIAYSHCIAHGIRMDTAMRNQKAAVDSGQWLLYRYDPRRARDGNNPLQLDSAAPRIKGREYFDKEGRFQLLTRTNPREAEAVFAEAQRAIEHRRKLFESMSSTLDHERK